VEIRILDSAESVAKAAAARVAAAAAAKPSLVLGLPAGRTPVATYIELQRLHREQGLDFSRVRTFSLDEFVGLAPDDAATFRQFLKRHFLNGVNVDPARARFLNGAARDLDLECREYEAALAGVGYQDLQLLGVGVNGHIGFNEPADSQVAGTHRVTLHEQTRRNNAEVFGGALSRVPTEALTMGLGTILRAAAIVLIATGSTKAETIARAVRGPMTTHVPASWLQAHRNVELYLDREAASRLG
jgi:glucosamine-6-phosphate deaminase